MHSCTHQMPHHPTTTAAATIIHALYWGQSVHKATRQHRKAAKRNHLIDVTITTHERMNHSLRPWPPAKPKRSETKSPTSSTTHPGNQQWTSHQPTTTTTPPPRNASLSTCTHRLRTLRMGPQNPDHAPPSPPVIAHPPRYTTPFHQRLVDTNSPPDFLQSPECCLVKPSPDVPWKLRRLCCTTTTTSL